MMKGRANGTVLGSCPPLLGPYYYWRTQKECFYEKTPKFLQRRMSFYLSLAMQQWKESMLRFKYCKLLSKNGASGKSLIKFII